MPELWVPDAARVPRRDSTASREVISVCRIPVNVDGEICGRRFFTGEEKQVQQHALRCAREHGDAIRAWRERSHPSILKPWDPEFAGWVRGNRRAILEGRVRM